MPGHGYALVQNAASAACLPSKVKERDMHCSGILSPVGGTVTPQLQLDRNSDEACLTLRDTCSILLVVHFPGTSWRQEANGDGWCSDEACQLFGYAA